MTKTRVDKEGQVAWCKENKKKNTLKSCNGIKVVLWEQLFEPLLYDSPPGLPHNKLQKKDIKVTLSSSCHINEQAFKQFYSIQCMFH